MVPDMTSSDLIIGTKETDNIDNSVLQEPIYDADILFTFTSFTRWVLDSVRELTKRLNKSNYYRIISHSTQPIHAASVVLVIILCMIFFPADRKSNNILATKFTCLTYFLAFSLHIGSQFWMTFVSGLSLYFNLARHAFGDVQKILFPRYFTLNCVLSAITVVQFGRLHSSSFHEWDVHIILQLIMLTLCFMVEFCIRIYLVPSVLELISSKTAIEKAAGIGQEVGHYELGPLLQCPHYMSIHKAFRRVHMYTAVGNIFAIMCSAFHLYFLAYKWTVRLP